MMHKGGAVGGERILAFACIAVLGVILSLGLWPFHVPANDVEWLGTRNGLRLGRFSTVVGTAPLEPVNGGAGSLELWIEAAQVPDSSTILSFARPERAIPFRIRQSATDIVLATESGGKSATFYADDIFLARKPLFLTITSGGKGTELYIDGVLVKAAPRFRLSPDEFTGRLILGDAPGQPDSWSGKLLGAAVYRQELTAAEVRKHFQTWTGRGRPEIAASERCVALYLFQERAGTVVHSLVETGADLQIPARYMIADKKFMEPVWEEFRMSREYGQAVLKNIVGFLPVGFVFYAYLSGIRQVRRAVIVTVLLGLLISLTIEILQGFLPSRDSGTSDLITNTLGTRLGVLLYRRLRRRLAAMFPWLPLFPEPYC